MIIEHTPSASLPAADTHLGDPAPTDNANEVQDAERCTAAHHSEASHSTGCWPKQQPSLASGRRYLRESPNQSRKN